MALVRLVVMVLPTLVPCETFTADQRIAHATEAFGSLTSTIDLRLVLRVLLQQRTQVRQRVRA